MKSAAAGTQDTAVLQMMRRVRSAVDKLKAERVQDKLQWIPGWRLVPGRKALDRVREFPDPATASSYAGFVNDFAARHGQPAKVVLHGAKVVITLEGRRVAGAREVTDEVVAFAKALG
jgi:pterin-4a-carbinolamine dehydratase